jgi:hypothetical protein
MPIKKFYLFNTLFFGFLGSYIGVAIISVIGALIQGHGSPFHIYLYVAPLIGFIPASTTGYLYAKNYLKCIQNGEELTFSKEIKTSAYYGFVVTTIYLFAIYIILYFVSNPGDVWNLKILAFTLLEFLPFTAFATIGVISSSICANLISEWNLKIVNQAQLKNFN